MLNSEETEWLSVAARALVAIRAVGERGTQIPIDSATSARLHRVAEMLHNIDTAGKGDGIFAMLHKHEDLAAVRAGVDELMDSIFRHPEPARGIFSRFRRAEANNVEL